MGLQLTSSDQVLALAPDAGSASAGKKLSALKNWKSTGMNEQALWGECQGSALYQVRIDLSTLTIQCSCPSRKHPCKHALGLLLVAVTNPDAVTQEEPPEWITSWLNKRAAVTRQKEPKKAAPTDATPTAAQLKRAEKKKAQMLQGLDTLDLWLNNLIRNGLASVETRPAKFWEDQAAQMRDAQLAGIDNRLRSIATIPNSSPHWPEKLLMELGKLQLLTHAFRQMEQLNQPLQEEVRQLIGLTLTQEEVTARGEIVTDNWLFLGQRIDSTEKVRSQWTWLFGQHSQRPALILQFTFGQTPFPEVFHVGFQQQTTLTFYPGAMPVRARVDRRTGEVTAITEQLPGARDINAFLDDVAMRLSQNPWQDRFLCMLQQVTPLCSPEQKWYVRDREGKALPIYGDSHWTMLALSGGQPVDFVGEWNGEQLTPLGILVNNQYYLL